MALALIQHATITAQQLAEIGLARRTVRHYASIGWLHRIHHGVYALVPEPLLTIAGRRMAAVLACGPGAALSHLSAAALRRLARDGRAVIDVTVPTRAGRDRPGIRIHRSSTLRPSDVTIVDGIPCTTVARTIFDLADTFPRRRVERVIDEAVVLGLFDLHALDEQIAHGTPGRHRAATTLQSALSAHRQHSTPTESQLEERALALIRATPGLPPPELQKWIDLGDGEELIRADFVWRDARVILETDGAVHRQGRRVAADARRDQRAARAGWQTLRATWDQVTLEPTRLSATLLAVVTARTPPSASSAASKMA